MVPPLCNRTTAYTYTLEPSGRGCLYLTCLRTFDNVVVVIFSAITEDGAVRMMSEGFSELQVKCINILHYPSSNIYNDAMVF